MFQRPFLFFGLPNSGLEASAAVLKLDTSVVAQSNLIYDQVFGVEGAIPAVISDAVLGAVCLILVAKDGRLGELKMKGADIKANK